MRLTSVFLALLLGSTSCGGERSGAPDGDGDDDVVDAAASDASVDDALGTVTVTADTCPDGTGTLAGTTCELVEVSCPGVPPASAKIRITPAASAVPARGTIVFGLGGGGDEWYERDGTGSSSDILRGVISRGFRVVQRAWTQDWELGPGGMAAVACRYATLLTWVHDTVQDGGALCATGNSGGSSEIAYALTRYGRGAILDLAVPTGGPVMTRLDRGCIGDDAWHAECQALVPAGSRCEPAQVQCDYVGTSLTYIDDPYTPSTPCAHHDPSFAPTWLADGLLGAGGVFAFPDTAVRQIIGDRDCTPALPHGLLWHQALTSDATVVFALDTPHSVQGTPDGAAAIIATMDDACIPRHGP
jgi:hypothetical protein